ncbi:unnamed protein product, partial [Diamesa hyperborea]
MDAERPVDLYEFLVEAELQQYYTSIKNELKITAVSQIKYATDEDFRSLNFSRPEIRRIRKYYEKYFNLSYLSKIKRLLQNPRRDEVTIDVLAKVPSSPNKSISVNKHIIPLDSISVNKQLGVGEFGIVQQGVWTNGNDRIQVAIKCLCRERMQSNPMEFLKEAAIMHSIEHENIVRLYGVVLSTDSLMLVTELAHLRSLLECLKDSDLRVKFLTVSVLCDFAIQICNGMLYLESNRLIHRDLAARNILVFNKDKVKISDFGLSRALGVGKDYYKTNFNVNLKLPIAWCAPECVNYLKFTNSSDVWAFAVCLWEMFSYGFQPWVAMTGHQILEAIDKPNFQRLEQPECCSKEYYALMLKCWNHDPVKRPKFSEIYQILPDMKPEQLKTVMQLSEVKKDHLAYRQGDIITVLDRSANSPYWRGVLNCGQVGLFNPANTVAYIESLPSSTSNRDSFVRSTMERTSKRKLKTEMISSPQNDLKHTGHVGIDGAYFGNVAFLSNSQTYNNTLPRQVVTPYKPSEDLEQTPLLLPPTPTSPDSTQTGSAYFSDASNLIMNASTSTQHTTDGLPFKFQHNNASKERHNGSDANLFNESNPFAHSEHQLLTHQTQPFVVGDNFVNESHEYHEISDDEQGDKVFDFGTSLLDEMDFMFRSMSSTNGDSLGPPPLTPNFDNVNKRNELAELKLNRKNSGAGTSNGGTTSYKSKKKPTTMKAISVKDEKILNHAIEIANKMSATSMTDLDQNSNQSPRRKFSFRFPNLSSNHDKDNPGAQMMSGTSTLTHQNNSSKERRNFSEDVKNVPDLQRFRSLTEIENYHNEKRDIKIPMFDKKSSDFCFEKSHEILSKPFAIDLNPATLDKRYFDKKTPTSRGFFFNYSSSGGSVGGGALNINRNLFLSPTKRMGFNVSNQNFVPQTRKFDDSFASVGSPRQRSMSFTDNFEIKSPILLKPQMIKSQLNAKSMKASSMEDDGCFILPSQSQLIANKPRNIITYKPKTVRARNLRRLSYNPLNMTNSSSSSDNESDMDHSMAHSECDIRTKMYSSRFQKRRQQFLTNHRKLNNSTSSGYYDQNSCRNHSQYSNNSSIGNVNGRNKLYGSNSSIKS